MRVGAVAQTLEILIPYWGDPDYMMQAVESVFAQSNPNWMLTIVDDAYHDLSISQYFATLNDPRVRYIRKEHNEGITANFRTCVAIAKQPLIVLLGCDDRLLPNYVDTILTAHALYPEAAFIQPGVRVIDTNGDTWLPLGDQVKLRCLRPRGNQYHVLSGEDLAVSLLHGDWLYWPSLAFRTDKLREVDFRDEFLVAQDFAIIMDMVVKGDQLLLAPDVCFEYRRHKESASSLQLMNGRRFTAERAFYALAEKLVIAKNWRRARWAARARLTSRGYAVTLLPAVARRGDWKTTWALVRHAMGS